MLKGDWWVGGGLEQFSVSPRPLGFWFGTKGLGAKGLGPGLVNKKIRCRDLNLHSRMNNGDKELCMATLASKSYFSF